MVGEEFKEGKGRMKQSLRKWREERLTKGSTIEENEIRRKS